MKLCKELSHYDTKNWKIVERKRWMFLKEKVYCLILVLMPYLSFYFAGNALLESKPKDFCDSCSKASLLHG